MPSTANNIPTLQTHGAAVPIVDSIGSDTYAQVDPFQLLLSPNKALSFPKSSAIVLQPRSVSFTPNALGVTQHIYSSPNYADIVALANYFADWACSYTIQEGPVHVITVSAPWDTIAEEDFTISPYAAEQFELVPNQGTKSLLYTGVMANPFWPITTPGNLVPLPIAVQGAITNALANNQPGFTMPTGSASLLTASAACAAEAQQVFQYMKAGIEGVPSYTQTLKRTAVIDVNNASGAFQTEVDDYTRLMQTSGSYNYVMSTPNMLRAYAIPANTVAKFMQPSFSMKYGIVGVDAFVYNVYAGWLVKPPVVMFIGRNKLQVTQEFVWDAWASGLYFIGSPASDFPLIYDATAALAAA